jgi:molybdenum cofactor cytidylyltransferase
MKLSHALRIQSGDVVAVVGGGGKTTTMFRLAGELVEQDLRVLTTTSTRIFTGQMAQAPIHLAFDPEQQTIAEIAPQLAAALDQHGQVLLVRPIEKGATKALGISPETIDALSDNSQIDVIIVEADGARNHPFKAPASYEPVIPNCTTLVVPVVGLDVVGQPLSEESAHRPEIVCQLTGLQPGQPVTVDTIAQVFCHPQGGLKNVPPQARVLPLLNKAESPKKAKAAREIAEKLLACEQIDAVAIGSVQREEDPISEVRSRTAVVILAAGESTRFGSPKQLARWGEQTFVQQVADVALASQVDSVIVVLGAEVEHSQAALSDRPVQVVVNENWAEGQSASVEAGLEILPKNIGSVVFMLVDQPGITPGAINVLIERHRQSLAPAVRPEYKGEPGNPVLFDRRLFPELKSLSGDVGGRVVLKKYFGQVERVAVGISAILQDFDRPEDLTTIGQ